MMQSCTNIVQCIAEELPAADERFLLFEHWAPQRKQDFKFAMRSLHMPERSACDRWQSSGGEPKTEGCGLPNQGVGTSLSGLIKGCNAPGDSRLTSQHSAARDLRRLLAPACSDRSSSRS